jgi:transposase
MDERSTRVSDLLHEAAETHHRVFRITDGADDDWASWYAQWLVGPIVAAIVLCAWSHPGRCGSDGAFAMLAGAAPIPASSGQTVLVRRNRSGDRQLNQALHLVVLTRLRYDPATRAYAQRRRTQGKTNREIRRCLVRYVARQLYRLLAANPGFDPT